MKCATCDKPIRKGTGRCVLVLQGNRDVPRMATVCARCHATAVPVVVPPPGTIAPPCSNCGQAPAKFCADCYRGACENVRHLSGANAGLHARNARKGVAP